MNTQRHGLVLVRPAAWRSLLDSRPDMAVLSQVARWVDNGWPLIRRRPLPGESGIALGLPLPPFAGRHRFALTLPPEAIRASLRPPLLADCAAVAPPAWRGTIAELVALDKDVRCFGSLAWEMLTGLAYLSPGSDLDLLWAAASPAHADGLSQAIAAIASTAPMRLDGELLLPSGYAVQWREWRAQTPHVLAKYSGGVTMMAREALFA